jgi:hypothetical protein
VLSATAIGSAELPGERPISRDESGHASWLGVSRVRSPVAAALPDAKRSLGQPHAREPVSALICIQDSFSQGRIT